MPNANQPFRQVERSRLGEPGKPVTGEDFKNLLLIEANGAQQIFENCDFSYSVFERAYFHRAKFRSCKFIGVKFIDSNFRSVNFDNCDFKYASVQRSHFEKRELIRNLPPEPNLAREWLQQLRVNAVSLGITQDTNFFIVHELEAEREHWRRARRSADVYYRNHYSGLKERIHVYWQSLKLWLDLFVWGHGESVLRLFLATAATALFLAGTLFSIELQDSSVNAPILSLLLDSLGSTWRLLIDLPSFDSRIAERHPVWSSAVLLLRYLSIGLFVAVVFRKLSWR